MLIRVSLAGATGWAGSALALAISKTDDISLVSAVSRTHAGRSLGNVLNEPHLNCPIHATAEEALTHPCDVFFEFTKPDVAKSNVLAALQRGVHVVIGTSGLTDADYAEIGEAAETHGKAVLAVGNFALTVVLLQKFAEIAGISRSGRSSIMPATRRRTRPAEPCVSWLTGCPPSARRNSRYLLNKRRAWWRRAVRA